MLVYLSLVYFPLGHKDRLIVNTDENLGIKKQMLFSIWSIVIVFGRVCTYLEKNLDYAL